jgi:hypothetical protein
MVACPDVRVRLSRRVTLDDLYRAAEWLKVPWDSEAVRRDGTPWWDLPPPHVLTRHAIMASQDGVILFYADDEATVSADEDHPIWGALLR